MHAQKVLIKMFRHFKKYPSRGTVLFSTRTILREMSISRETRKIGTYEEQRAERHRH